MGLLIVEVSLPPAPSSGTMMSLSRNCGSLMTSWGPRTAPKVTWTPLNISYQCAIGFALKISSRIAVSCGMFCISFVGSENRGSVRRSTRPSAFATALNLSDVTIRTNQVSSEARYTFIAAFAGFFRSCSPKNFASHSAAWIETLAAQTPSARRDVVTYDPLPVRSRRYRAVTIAEYKPTAVALSPLPATGQVGGAPRSRVIDNRPLRAQYDVISNPGRLASGPFSPKPVRSA